MTNLEINNCSLEENEYVLGEDVEENCDGSTDRTQKRTEDSPVAGHCSGNRNSTTSEESSNGN